MVLTQPRILVTNTQPEAEYFAKDLRQNGFNCLISPLLQIHPVQHTPQNCDAVVITSRHALSAAAYYAPLPLFCVGIETAKIAADFGFKSIYHALNAESLFRLAAEQLSETARLLYLSGDVIHYDPQQTIARPLIIRDIVYESRLCGLSNEAAHALRDNEIDAVTLLSVRTAEQFCKQIHTRNLYVKNLTCFCLSITVSVVLPTDWTKVVASLPSRQSLLAALHDYDWQAHRTAL